LVADGLGAAAAFLAAFLAFLAAFLAFLAAFLVDLAAPKVFEVGAVFSCVPLALSAVS